jgi:hypothetical protein
METGREAEARKLAENGVANSGQYASFYKQMLTILDQKQSEKTESQK